MGARLAMIASKRMQPCCRRPAGCGAGFTIGKIPASGEYLKLQPHVHDTDGFFAAVLERRK